MIKVENHCVKKLPMMHLDKFFNQTRRTSARRRSVNNDDSFMHYFSNYNDSVK